MRRRKRQLAALGLAVVAMVVAMGAPVGAQNPNNKVEFIRGQGSDSTVDVMQKLDFAYNNTFGCTVVVGSGGTQNFNHECISTDFWSPSKSNENWDHDVALSFFALGSSHGITMLTNQGNPGTAKIDYARSSRAPRSSDNTGLRFVAYARDATPWVNFRGQNPADPAGQHTEAGTPAAGVDRLSVQQIKDIWFNTTPDTGDPAHTCVINNWNQVGGANSEIIVWTSQRGSGERATFDAFLASSGSDISEKCIPAQYKDTNLLDGNRVVFENDASPIRDCAVDPDGGGPALPSCTAGQDLQSIFHTGFGAYQAFPVHPTRGKAQGADLGSICTAEPAPNTQCSAASAIAPTVATISDGSYPFTRFIYNVYRSSTMTNPVPNPTKRYMGEHGWICRLNSGTLPNGHITNPKTSVNYGTEIENIISSTGFVNLPVGQTGLGDTSDSKCRLSSSAP